MRKEHIQVRNAVGLGETMVCVIEGRQETVCSLSHIYQNSGKSNEVVLADVLVSVELAKLLWITIHIACSFSNVWNCGNSGYILEGNPVPTLLRQNWDGKLLAKKGARS